MNISVLEHIKSKINKLLIKNIFWCGFAGLLLYWNDNKLFIIIFSTFAVSRSFQGSRTWIYSSCPFFRKLNLNNLIKYIGT